LDPWSKRKNVELIKEIKSHIKILQLSTLQYVKDQIIDAFGGIHIFDYAFELEEQKFIEKNETFTENNGYDLQNMQIILHRCHGIINNFIVFISAK